MCMYLHATISLSFAKVYLFCEKTNKKTKYLSQNTNFVTLSPFHACEQRRFFMTAVHPKMNLYRTLS